MRGLPARNVFGRTGLMGLWAVAIACCVAATSDRAIAQSVANDTKQTITYDQILAQPDNLELNFRYARQEASQGNLSGASTALERILLLEPEWNTARLFYAVVLYRLDDLLAAERELKTLSDRKLTEQQAKEVLKYQKLIKRRRQKFYASGYVGGGVRYDTNRNFATNLGDADSVLAFGLPASSIIPAQEDVSFRAFGGVKGRYRFDDVARHEVYFQAAGVYNEQKEVEEQSFSDLYVEAGLDYVTRYVTLFPHIMARTFAIDDNHYFSEVGVGFGLKGTLGPRFKWEVSADAFQQDFESIAAAPSGDLRTGDRYQVGASFKYALNARNRFGGGIYFDDKSADFDAFAYQAARLELEYMYLFGRGAYLKLQGSAALAEFDAPDPLISPTETRRDRRYVARLTLGAPVTTLGDFVGIDMPQSLSRLLLQFAIDYRLQDSTIGNYSYDNTGVEASLIWQF